jgi:hypothetical protein
LNDIAAGISADLISEKNLVRLVATADIEYVATGIFGNGIPDIIDDKISYSCLRRFVEYP